MNIPYNGLIREKHARTKMNQNTRHGVIEISKEQAGLSRKEESFLNIAVQMAKSGETGYKHGAVIVKNGRVMSLGVNKWRNKGIKEENTEWTNIMTTHAEVDALSRVTDPRGAVVYIARLNKHGEEKFSRPCFRCMKELHKVGVKRVVYTIDENSI